MEKNIHFYDTVDWNALILRHSLITTNEQIQKTQLSIVYDFTQCRIVDDLLMFMCQEQF